MKAPIQLFQIELTLNCRAACRDVGCGMATQGLVPRICSYFTARLAVIWRCATKLPAIFLPDRGGLQAEAAHENPQKTQPSSRNGWSG
jgi:hypothetical protein